MVTIGLIASLLLFAVLLLWGAVAMTWKVKERPSEASSHRESGVGINGGP